LEGVQRGFDVDIYEVIIDTTKAKNWNRDKVSVYPPQ
jgi:hypothetical protein